MAYQMKNDSGYEIRGGQLMCQYGPGQIIDFPNQALMTATPSEWKRRTFRRDGQNNYIEREKTLLEIIDKRLCRKLQVTKLLGFVEGSSYVAKYVRFPEWYFCPKCHKFQKIETWIEQHKQNASYAQQQIDPDMLSAPYCYCASKNKNGRRTKLVPVGIVAICEKGHIDDFPWMEYVHDGNLPQQGEHIQHILKFKESVKSAAGAQVSCTCGNVKFLSDIFSPEGFMIGRERKTCSGRHPWKRGNNDRCDKMMRAVQRGGSNVYFPKVFSSLSIDSVEFINKIQGMEAFTTLQDVIEDTKKDVARGYETPEKGREKIERKIREFSEDNSQELKIGNEVMINELKSYFQKDDGGQIVETDEVYKKKEYDVLNGSVEASQGAYFKRTGMDIKRFGLPYIKGISLINKVKEICVLTGFSRVEPPKSDGSNIVSLRQGSRPEESWYPASAVFGEGIFIEFDKDAIDTWMNNNGNDLVQRLNENISKSGGTIKYMLLHTLAHLLIKQLCYECGYNVASLKERIYCDKGTDDASDPAMQGILIYTASGDSDGTLGGLVRLGESDRFPSIFKKALRDAIFCSNDPICSLSTGQGRDSLNLAACHSCTLLPETSCEAFNCFLDRALLVGTVDNRRIGFYSRYLFDGEPWPSPVREEQLGHDNRTDSEDRMTQPTNPVVGAEEIDDDNAQLVMLPQRGEQPYDYDGRTVTTREEFNFYLDADPVDQNTTEILNRIVASVGDRTVARHSSEDGFLDEIWPIFAWTESKVALFDSDDHSINRLKEYDWICITLRDIQDDRMFNAMIRVIQEGGM